MLEVASLHEKQVREKAAKEAQKHLSGTSGNILRSIKLGIYGRFVKICQWPLAKKFLHGLNLAPKTLQELKLLPQLWFAHLGILKYPCGYLVESIKTSGISTVVLGRAAQSLITCSMKLLGFLSNLAPPSLSFWPLVLVWRH